MRRKPGIFRRLQFDQVVKVQQEHREFFEVEHTTDHLVHQMSKGSLYVHIRQKQLNISRPLSGEVYREFHASSIEQRKIRLNRRRGGWTHQGQLHLVDRWPPKTSMYGFDIYAGIDAYSRYIVWFYVGVSANTSYDVLAQYLSAGVRKGKHYTQMWQQTTSLTEHEDIRTANSDEAQSLNFKDCFVYSKSLRYIKIEMWWRNLRLGVLNSGG